jgi:chromosome segregation ATPase
MFAECSLNLQLASLETKMYLERTQLDLKDVREALAEQKALASKLQGEVEAARDKVYDYRLQVEKYSKEAVQHGRSKQTRYETLANLPRNSAKLSRNSAKLSRNSHESFGRLC